MKTILFQGDSITDCDRLRDGNKNFFLKLIDKINRKTPLGNGYPALVAAELSAEADGEYRFVNRGVGGDKIPDVYARIVGDIIAVKPDYISLLVGVNDIWRAFDSNNPTGTERFKKVYNILIEELKAELPNTKIMILEPFVLEGTATRNTPGQPEKYKNFRAGVLEVAAITKKIADNHGIKFVPLQSMLDSEAEKVSPAVLLSDGVHPTKLGHELIKREWIKAFKEL